MGDPETYEAVCAFSGTDPAELSLREGERVVVKSIEGDWLFGFSLTSHQGGWFPISYIRPCPLQEGSKKAGFITASASPLLGDHDGTDEEEEESSEDEEEEGGDDDEILPGPLSVPNPL